MADKIWVKCGDFIACVNEVGIDPKDQYVLLLGNFSIKFRYSHDARAAVELIWNAILQGHEKVEVRDYQ